jgi:glycosyltransferase involved in cell wall biosynthesis
MPVDLSVIICTRNRSHLLENTLESLVQQQCAPWTFEIILVDNGSTDDTKAVAESLASKGSNLRYVYEDQPGIGHARNVGLAASRGRFVAYLDDDAEPVPGWCAVVCRTLQEFESLPENRLGAIGGPVEPVFEGGKPDWISPKFRVAYTIVDFGPDRKTFPNRGGPLAVNMALLRKVHEVNTWNDSLPMCEEADLRIRIAQKGLEFIYVPEMKVRHFIPRERLSAEWLAKRYFAEGVAQRYLQLGFRRRLRYTVTAFGMLPLLWALSAISPFYRKLAYRCKAINYWGYLAGLFGIRDMSSLDYISWRRKSAGRHAFTNRLTKI